MLREAILSFDVGIKNMAYCMLDVTTRKIIAWDMIDLSCNTAAKDLETLSKGLIDALDELLMSHDGVEIWHILIENQPVMKNPTMKSVQMMLFTYFRMMHIHGQCTTHVKFVSAMKKNSYMKSKGYELKAKDYQANKATSITCAKDWLEANPINDAWKEMLEAHKKKDDLCDALLQIISSSIF